MNMLDETQKHALDAIVRGHNVVLTGHAGTGKSYLLRETVRLLRDSGKTVALLCTTGMACLQYEDLGATTVHRNRSVNGEFDELVASWAGLLDGRYDNLTLQRLVMEDDKMARVRKNVQAADVVIVDEVSMLSEKDFDQLELVCRVIRNPVNHFGGIQVVVSGDFYQLAPVANSLYGDSGNYCFESRIWQNVFPHHINLRNVKRQHEPLLIKAIQETAKGDVSTESDIFLKELKRDLPADYHPVHLFSRNFDAEIYNNEELLTLQTEERVYEAKRNSGSIKYLRKILAPKFLHLKLDCPVILLRNIGGKLVNGLTGTVKVFDNDIITVYFPTINETHQIARHNFSIYDVNRQCNVAERQQFPLRLAYGLTIHKCQGMTLEHVCVNCRGIFQSGQLSVAIGRCATTSGLQVLHYSKGLCKKPRGVVEKFYTETGKLFAEDIKCCDFSTPLNVCTEEENIAISSSDIIESDDSDFDESDLNIIEEEASGNLPSYIDAENIITRVIVVTPVTEKQKRINSICKSISIASLRTYLCKSIESLKDILPPNIATETTSTKLWTDSLSHYHSYISSDIYKSSLTSLYGNTCLTDEHTYVSTQLVYCLLKDMVHHFSEQFRPNISESSSTCISEAGKAKLRYVGGMCVAKAKQHSCNIVIANLGNRNKTAIESVQNNKQKVRVLENLEASQDEVNTGDDTFFEIDRRQSVRRGLTYINEPCFEFFLFVDDKVRHILNSEILQSQKENIFEYANNCIIGDENLGMIWTEMCQMDISSEISFSVYCDVIQRFLMVSQKQFLKDTRDSLSLKKKKAHREEIKKKQEQKKMDVSISMAEIPADNSDNKMSSHLKLKINCMSNSSCFMSKAFTKADIRKLCSSYDIQCVKSSNKVELNDQLVQAVLSSDRMTNCDILCASTSASGQLASGSKRKYTRD